jgi:hypothetical protein
MATNPHHHQSHVVQTQHGHSFGRTRFNRHRLTFVNPPAHSAGKAQPLPKPIGKAPFHLDLKDVIPAEQYKAIVASDHLVSIPQATPAASRIRTHRNTLPRNGRRLFEHPADLSINWLSFISSATVYISTAKPSTTTQFYEPYEHYLAPILAVPGNHRRCDSARDIAEAFVRNYRPVNQSASPDVRETSQWR